jgi:hypothetical protein
LIEFRFIGRVEVKQFAETTVEGVGMETASGGEFGSRFNDPGNNHGYGEIALAIVRAGSEDGIELKILKRAEHSGDMAMRKRAGDTEGIRESEGGRGGGRGRAGQGELNSTNLLGRKMSEVGEGAGFDLTGLAVRFPKEESRGRVPIGDGGDIHAYILSHNSITNKLK